MSWFKDSLTSSVGRKLVMGITGLFLITFLLAHLAGNIPLLLDDEGAAFNAYAHFMKHNKLIALSEVILFLGFIVHIYQGINLYRTNKAARTQKYAIPNKNPKVSKASKIMGPLGMIILIFLILHLYDFFAFKYGMRSAGLQMKSYEGGEAIPDLWSLVIVEFQTGIAHLIVYPLAMIAVSYHLLHGFQSAFQTLGARHKKIHPINQGYWSRICSTCSIGICINSDLNQIRYNTLTFDLLRKRYYGIKF
jgi:succinate dehydrogenase / fumarate reductase cytochrome b subunit